MDIHADIYCTNVITSVRYTRIEVNIKYSKINWEQQMKKDLCLLVNSKKRSVNFKRDGISAII